METIRNKLIKKLIAIELKGDEVTHVKQCFDELLPFEPTGKWKVTHSLVNGGVCLLQHSAFLGEEVLPTDTVAEVQKAIADLNCALKAISEGHRSGIQLELVTHLQQTVAKFDGKNKEMLNKAANDARAKVKEANDTLLNVCYGSGEERSWCHALKSKSTMDDVLTKAKETGGLLDCDIKTLGIKVQETLEAVGVWKAAMADAGFIAGRDDTVLLDTAEAFTKRGTTTIMESKLMRAYDEGMDADDLRTSVQAALREFRNRSQVKEREVLFDSLYRWAYGVLTKRR